MRLDLFCKQISLTVIIFARNWGNCAEKNYVSVEILTHLVDSDDSSPVHCVWSFGIYL